MKLITIFSLLLFSFMSQAQDYYDLNWKLKNDEKIAYLTVMEQIDSKVEFPAIFESFQNALRDNTDSEEFDFNQFFEPLYKGIANLSMITILQRQHDWIDVCLIRENLDESESIDSTAFQQILKGIQLRGVLSTNGDIMSFYTKSDQKNLLAVFFQLPSHPVSIGDKWEIDLNWITTDHNFKCDSMNRVNEVELIGIKNVNNDTIAVLKYKNYERIIGNFNIPFANETVPTMFDMRYDAICEFSISKGRWRSYSGILSYISTGYQNAEYKQKYALIEKKDIPRRFLKYIE